MTEPVQPESPLAADASAQKPGWERSLISDLLRETIVERRRARRWKIAMRVLSLLVAVFAISVAAGMWKGDAVREAVSSRHTAVIELTGELAEGGEIDARRVARSLDRAFGDAGTAAVLLRINSPGGSPVQAGIIHDEIRRQRKLHPDTPLYAVVEEMCASGGYYVAAAADRIYVDKASIIGSIGVLMNGFGFTGLMDKLGIERRLLTAGMNKAILDPFSPMKPEHKEHAQKMLDEIHQQFIKVVKDGRGDRLKDNGELFSGLFWTGERGIALGLADELGSVSGVARDVVKAPKLVDFTQRESFAERFAKQVGASLSAGLVRVIGGGPMGGGPIGSAGEIASPRASPR